MWYNIIKERKVLKIRKPRLSKRTIETLYNEGKAYSGKYEYEITRDWSDKYNNYVENLTRWDEDNNYKEWEIPPEGIWAFEKN
jgi:hypothetical protein